MCSSILLLLLSSTIHAAILSIFRYAVPDTPLSIAANVGREELNTLINTLIQEAGHLQSNDVIQFEFLVLNEFLRYD